MTKFDCLDFFKKFCSICVVSAIYGYHFCKAAKRGFELLLSNAVRVVAINTVGDFCLFLAKIMVVFAVVFIGIKITEVSFNEISRYVSSRNCAISLISIC